jgi:protein gp37
MGKTDIEWTAVQAPDGSWVPGFTFNGWWGCQAVSPACKNCYAETFSHRLGFDLWGPGAAFRFFGDEHWDKPRIWNARAAKLGLRLRVFCGSMCDWLQDRPELEVHRARLLRLIDETPALDWLMLSKRPENLARLTPWAVRGGAPHNVMLGTTVEDQQRADARIPHLLALPSQRPAELGRRFLSCEPLLGPINLYIASRTWGPRSDGAMGCGHCCWKDGRCDDVSHYLRSECPYCRGTGAVGNPDWVICGSESGHPSKVRRTEDEWVASLRDQCVAAGVPFFLKQLQDHAKPTGRVVSLPMFQGQQYRGQPDAVVRP